MHKCAECGEEVAMPYSCNFCSLKFCSDHRLPEKHRCLGLANAGDVGKRFQSEQSARRERTAGDVKGTKTPAQEEFRQWLNSVKDGADTDRRGEEVYTDSSPDVAPDGTLKEQSRPIPNDRRSPGIVATLSKAVLFVLWLPVLFLRSIVGFFWRYLRILLVGLLRGVVLLLKVGLVVGLVAGVAFGAFAVLGGGDVGSFNNALAEDTPTSANGAIAPSAATATETAAPKRTEEVVTATEVDQITETAYVPLSDVDRHNVETWVHTYVNEERKARGLPPLDYDSKLQKIARYHSENMAAAGFFSHEGPDGNFADRYDKFGYECKAYTSENTYLTGGENIAKSHYDKDVFSDRGIVHYNTPKELARGIVNQWMNSTGHRRNILNEHWNREGLGIEITDTGVVYATQNFC